MNNELIERIDIELTGLQSVLDGAKAAMPYERFAEISSPMDVLRDCKAALTQQQEAEPVGYVYEFVSQFSGATVWRHSAGEWNGQRPKSSRPYFFHPPKPAALPHWTDNHIKHESESGSWYAYDEVGLTYGTYETKDEARDALVIYEATQLHPAALPADIDADELSNFIRKIDGNHSMGAGALAENIVEWIGKQAAQPQVPDYEVVDKAFRLFRKEYIGQDYIKLWESCWLEAVEKSKSAAKEEP